jgi:hypothetical protein
MISRQRRAEYLQIEILIFRKNIFDISTSADYNDNASKASPVTSTLEWQPVFYDEVKQGSFEG